MMDDQLRISITDTDRHFMKIACDLASKNVDCGVAPSAP